MDLTFLVMTKLVPEERRKSQHRDAAKRWSQRRDEGKNRTRQDIPMAKADDMANARPTYLQHKQTLAGRPSLGAREASLVDAKRTYPQAC
jgi:hypothetical protein